MNLRNQLIILILIINLNLIIIHAKEANRLKNVFKIARMQPRLQNDRNYLSLNRKSPLYSGFICEFGSNCDDRLPFIDLFN